MTSDEQSSPTYSSVESRLSAIESMLVQMDERLGRLEELDHRGSFDTSPKNDDGNIETTPIFDLVSIDSKPTEANNSWTKHAWKLCLRNRTSNPLALEATVEFLDAEGFVVHDEMVYDMLLPANEEKTFRGYQLVDDSITDSICTVAARVRVVTE